MAPISMDHLRALALETGTAYRIWGESINEAAMEEIGDVQAPWPKDSEEWDVVERLLKGPGNMAKILGIQERLNRLDHYKYVHTTNAFIVHLLTYG
jgi:hypothetical protein